MEPKIAALVCAAGVGSRMRADRPKQYLPIAGRPMLTSTVRALAAVERIDEIVVVVSPGDPYIDEVMKDFPPHVRVLRAGGAERAESVRNGLVASGWHDDVWVLVHDAARPCVRPGEVGALLDKVLSDETLDGGILAQPAADTMKRDDGEGRILETVPRAGLWRAATPQLFRLRPLREALSGDLTGITDEASAMERRGAKIALVSSRATNFKVTEPADRALAGLILGEKNMLPIRVGQGYDSHRLVEGRPLILGGVHIPFEKGLDGHSDADVLLHAVTDALLGAASLGDIGTHFPPSDPKWRGADSGKLLSAVLGLAKEKGWRVVNLDATVVCERPKLGSYKATIRENVAKLLEVSVDAVSIKAKTNEKMDAVGREEGMVAQAVILLARDGGF